MNTKKGRPGKKDFELGWQNFYQLVQVLRPEVCVFLGVSAANHYNIGQKHADNYVLSEKQWGEVMFGRTKSIHLQLKKDEHLMEIYSVQHPSSYFSPDKCRQFLELKNPELLSRIKKSIQ